MNDGDPLDTEVADTAVGTSNLRVVVTAGGVPRPEEVAALTGAVTALAAAASAAAASQPDTRTVPAWRRAALLEQTRRPRLVRPSDLARR